MEASKEENGKHANRNRPCLKNNLDTFLISRIQEGSWFSDGGKSRQNRKIVPVPNFSICLLSKICLDLVIDGPISQFESRFMPAWSNSLDLEIKL